MAPVFPYSEYTKYVPQTASFEYKILTPPSTSAGEPITFYIGPKPKSSRFDIHHLLLCTNSPLFNDLTGVSKIIFRPLHLPTIDPAIFRLICVWLYERIPPATETPDDILVLMKIWVALSKLGIWDK